MPDVELGIRGKNLSRQALMQLRQDLDKTARALEQAAEEAEELGDESKDTKRDLTGLTIAAAALTAATTLMLKSFISAAVQLEKQKKGLIAVAGNAEEAERQLRSLREIAKLPGLGLEEALQGSIRLQAVGVSARDAEASLMAFGNALAIVGKGRADLEGVILGLTKMQAKGRVLAEEINMISERVPQVRKVMMEAFGTGSTEEIQKMGVTAKQFIKIMVDELSKLPSVSGGAANAIENLGDAVKELRASLGEVLLPAFVAILDRIASMVDWLNKLTGTQKAVIAWSVAATAGLASVAAAALGLKIALPKVWSAIQTLGASFVWLAAHPIVLVTLAVVALTTVIVLLARKSKKAAEDIKKSLGTIAEDVHKWTQRERAIRLEGLKELRDSIGKEIELYKKREQFHERVMDKLAASGRKSRERYKWTEDSYISLQETLRDLKKDYEDLEKAIKAVEGVSPGLRMALPPGPRPRLPSVAPTKDEIQLQRELERRRIQRIESVYARERALANQAFEEEKADVEKQLRAKVITDNKRRLLDQQLVEARADLEHKLTEIAEKETQEKLDAIKEASEKEQEIIADRNKMAEDLYIEDEENKRQAAEAGADAEKQAAKEVEGFQEKLRLTELERYKQRDIAHQNAMDLERLEEEAKEDAIRKGQEVLDYFRRRELGKRKELLKALTVEEKEYYRLLTGFSMSYERMNSAALKHVRKEWLDAGKTIQTGFQSALVILGNETIDWRHTFVSITREMESNFSSFLQSLVTDITDLGSVWKNLMKDMASSFLRMVADLIAQEAFRGLVNVLKDLSDSGAGNSSGGTSSDISDLPPSPFFLAPSAAARNRGGVSMVSIGSVPVYLPSDFENMSQSRIDSIVRKQIYPAIRRIQARETPGRMR